LGLQTNNSHRIQSITGYLLVISIFTMLTLPSFFSENMTLDGVIYASLSRNLANGLGTFWSPQLSNTLFKHFYEHPPLAIGFQSIWFHLLGDTIYTEKLYSLSTYILTSYLITLIWKEVTGTISSGWIPLLFYFTTTKIAWACSNNILENTMNIFVCFAVYSYLIALKKKSFYYVLLSGLSLSFSFFTKGFIGLFVWCLPFIFWKYSTPDTPIKKGILLIIATILPVFIVLITFTAEKTTSLTTGTYKFLEVSQTKLDPVSSFFKLLPTISFLQ